MKYFEALLDGVTRVELKPNPRIIPLLKHMNE